MQENNLLSLSYGKIINKDINATDGLLPESFEGYNIIDSDDIVLRLTDLQNDHTSLRVGISEQRGIITSAYLTLRNQSQNKPKFLYYQLHAFDICKGLYGMGAGVRQGLNWDGIKLLNLVVSSAEEQRKIVCYLDRQCVAIDSVIEKTKASIKEYKKLKQAVITQAVTKGVRGERPMKDSGIEMIGDIPADWDCVLIARIATLVRGGSPRPAGDERYFNGDFIPWITVAEVTNSIGKYIEKTETFLTEEGSKRSRIIEKGTLLISNSGATLGVPKITNIKGCINDGSVAFYNLEMEKEYLLYVLMSYTDELRKQRQGYGQPNLNTEIIKALSVPLPSDSEQIEIVQYLDGKIIEMDKLISKKEEFLGELESYKKSLIYEYVTGKKEVPQS
jgi:type I restriction enzyme S subunit